MQTIDQSGVDDLSVFVFTSFAEVPQEFRRHMVFPSQQEFFHSFQWFELLYETSLRATMTPRIYVLIDGKRRPQCALYCGAEGAGPGRRLRSLTNFYSLASSVSILSTDIPVETMLGTITRYLARERPRWDRIRLMMLRADSHPLRCLIEALRHVDFSTRPFFQYENWYLPTTSYAGFDGYFQERPSRLRNTITRRRKKLERTHGFRIEVARGDSPGLAALVRDFISVYGASWKEAEPFPEFIPTLAAKSASLGILRIGVLYVEDAPAAAQIWITSAKRAVIYKLAYDESYAELGVGSILSAELFRIALDEDGVDEIDYGVGSESYKRDWMSSVRRMDGLEAHNRRSVVGLGWSLAADAAQVAKRIRASLGRRASAAPAAKSLR